MGFRYNQQRLAQKRYDNVLDNKKESDCGKRFIQRVQLKRLRHRLSAEDRAFLRFVGLKPREK